MKNRVWLSYDLSVDGDYENLYNWLDSKNAKECGDSIAVFFYEYKNDLFEEILSDLKSSVDFRKNDRIYVLAIFSDNKYSGKFIIGKRKSAPWIGYAGSEDEIDE